MDFLRSLRRNRRSRSDRPLRQATAPIVEHLEDRRLLSVLVYENHFELDRTLMNAHVAGADLTGASVLPGTGNHFAEPDTSGGMTLTLDELPTHSALKVSLTLYLMGDRSPSIDLGRLPIGDSVVGTGGPDWTVGPNGYTASFRKPYNSGLDYGVPAFKKGLLVQRSDPDPDLGYNAYGEPRGYKGGQHIEEYPDPEPVRGTTAWKEWKLAYMPDDASYTVIYTINHDSAGVNLTFAGDSAKWGIDDITVVALTSHECSGCGSGEGSATASGVTAGEWGVDTAFTAGSDIGPGGGHGLQNWTPGVPALYQTDTADRFAVYDATGGPYWFSRASTTIEYMVTSATGETFQNVANQLAEDWGDLASGIDPFLGLTASVVEEDGIFTLRLAAANADLPVDLVARIVAHPNTIESLSRWAEIVDANNVTYGYLYAARNVERGDVFSVSASRGGNTYTATYVAQLATESDVVQGLVDAWTTLYSSGNIVATVSGGYLKLIDSTGEEFAATTETRNGDDSYSFVSSIGEWAGDPQLVTFSGSSSAATGAIFIITAYTYAPIGNHRRQLVHDNFTNEYILVDSDGGVTRFYDASTANAAYRFAETDDGGTGNTSFCFKSYVDGSGNILRVSDDDAYTFSDHSSYGIYGHPTLLEWDPAADGFTQVIALTYNTAGLATAEVTAGGLALDQASFTYYGAEEAGGVPNALKSSTRNGQAGVYYRYYTNTEDKRVDSEATGVPGAVKYKLGSDAYLRLFNDFGSDDLTEAEIAANVHVYADVYYEYDLGRHVSKQVNAGEQDLTDRETVTSASAATPWAPGYNHWEYKTTTTTFLPGSERQIVESQRIVYSNWKRQPMLDVLIAGGSQQATYYRYDDAGRLVLMAHPSAIVPLTVTLTDIPDDPVDLLCFDNEDEEDLFEYDEQNRSAYLKDSEGLIEWTVYGSETSADEVTANDVVGYLKTREVQHGDLSTPITVSSYTYWGHSDGRGNRVYPLATETVYPDANDPGNDPTTTYKYAWDDVIAFRMLAKKTIHPGVSTDQNGPGTDTEEVEIYDALGRVTWRRDAEGCIEYTSYSESIESGWLVRTTTVTSDVDILKIDEPRRPVDPFTSTPWISTGGLHLVTVERQRVELGSDNDPPTGYEELLATDPSGQTTLVTRYAGVWSGSGYLEETRTYSGWHTVDEDVYLPTGPVQVGRTIPGLGISESLSFVMSTGVSSGTSVGMQAIPWSEVLSFSRTYSDSAGRITDSDQYFNLDGLSYSVASFGTEGTHFFRTRYGYDYLGRQDRVVSPSGTITRSVFGSQSRLLSTWMGTSDTVAPNTTWSPANPGGMVQISRNVYDHGGVGDGNLTAQISYPGDVASPSATAEYAGEDVTVQGGWKGRYALEGLIVNSHADQPPFYAGVTFTSAGNLVWADTTTDARALERLDGGRTATAYSSDSEFTVRLTFTDLYPHRVRFYFVDWDSAGRSQTIEILRASDNAILSSRSISSFSGGQWLSFDLRGDVKVRIVKTGTGSAVLSGIAFDPANALVQRMTYDFRNRLVVTEGGGLISYTTYDNLGQSLSQMQYAGTYTFADANSDGVPDVPTTTLLTQSETAYDNLGRPYESTVYSVNSGVPSTSGLVSRNWYDQRGNVIKTSQPGGLVAKYRYDGAGRTTHVFATDGGGDSTWADADDVLGDIVLSQQEMTYDANGNVIFSIDRQRFHEEAGTGELGDPAGIGGTVPARASYAAAAYDRAGRTAGSIDFGTHGGTGPGLRIGGSVGQSGTDWIVDSEREEPTGVFVGFTLFITAGTGAGQVRLVTGYELSTHTITVDDDFTTALDATSEYVLCKAGLIAGSVGQIGLDGVTITDSTRWEPTGTFVGYMILITDGDGAGERRLVTAYDADTHQITLDAVITGLGAGSRYVLIDAGERIGGAVEQAGADWIIDTARAESTDAFVGFRLLITGGTGAGQPPRQVTGYDASTHTLTVKDDFTTALDSTSRYILVTVESLITSYKYGVAEQVYDVIDASEKTARTQYDALGRTLYSWEAYDTASTRKTGYNYDSGGRLLTMTAFLANDDFETTEYTYGVGGETVNPSSIYSNDLLAMTAYPDKTTGAPSTQASAQIVFSYNALGQIMTKVDQNGTTHTFTYDTAGRLTLDAIAVATNNPQGVDQGIVKFGYGYDDAGRPDEFTSYDDTDAVVNQVVRQYNGFGQLTAEFQSHSGAVNIGVAPAVRYTYSDMKDEEGEPANHSRLARITYPSGRVLTYGYGSGTLNDSISRLSFLADGNGTTTHLEEYAYLGLGTVVERRHPETGIDLTYIKKDGESDGDAGDQYTGLDRFGRVIDQRWTNSDGTKTTDRFGYGYDLNGNRLYKDNLVNDELSELYSYDNLSRLTAFERGELNGTKDAITSPSLSRDWTLDEVGNWTDYSGESQERVHNFQNQVTEVEGEELTYDNNGNMTTDEEGRQFIYDAWNRRVKTEVDAVEVQTLAYDALGRRISTSDSDTDFYYSAQWQVIEERVGGSTSMLYVWSPVYVDALILREAKVPVPNLSQVDGSFGDGQIGVLGPNTYTYAAFPEILVQPDGKVLAVGSKSIFEALVYRFNTDGSVDFTFGQDGYATVPAGHATRTLAALQPDGKIVLGGDSYLARLNPDGTPDTTFVGDNDNNPDDGWFGTGFFVYGLAVQADGKILAAGIGGPYGSPTNWVARYNASGTLDTAFAGDGFMETDFTLWPNASAVAVQDDGMIVVAGYKSGSPYNRFAIGRYTSSGVADTSFNGGQTQIIDMGVAATASAVAIQADDKIVIAGSASAQAIVRLNSNGTLDTSFDDDGKLTLLTNGIAYAVRLLEPDQYDNQKILVAGSAYNGSQTDMSVIRLLSDGTLDTLFSGDGQDFVDYGGTDYAKGLAVQSDGKILLGGRAGVTPSLARLMPDGGLDAGFDQDGIVAVNLDGRQIAYATAIQNCEDGPKIVVAGSQNGTDFMVARYNLDGTLDTSFSGDGWLTTDFSGGTDIAYALAIDADGKIVVAGKTNTDFALARYDTDGTLDSTFGTGGKVTTNVGSTDVAYAITIDGNGKIVVAGVSANNFALARYNANGTLDDSFDGDGGGNGKFTTDFGGTDIAYGVAVDGNGKIVVAGVSANNFALARYNANGTLDDSFDGDGGGNGKFTTDFGSVDVGRAMAIQPDDKIVVGGWSSSNFAVARYNAADGTLDTTFDSDGKTTVDFGATEYGYALALQKDGKIVIAGSKSDYANFAIARLTPAGVLDPTFDGDGKVTTDIGGSDTAWGLAIQPDGKIVAAGQRTNGSLPDDAIALVRYHDAVRLYVQQDANFNVTAVTDSAGVVLERYVYEPYGSFTVLNADWSVDEDGQSDYGQLHLHQGGRYDAASGLYHFRNRDYTPSLGRWVQQDPMGYVDGMSLYEYVTSSPAGNCDSMGLATQPTTAPATQPAVGFQFRVGSEPPPNSYQTALDDMKKSYASWKRGVKNFTWAVWMHNEIKAHVLGGTARGWLWAANMLSHFQSGSGATYNVPLINLFIDDKGSADHAYRQLDAAMRYVERHFASVDGKSIVSTQDYLTEAADSTDWHHALGSYRTWSEASDISCSETKVYSMKWTVHLRDVYDWDVNSSKKGGTLKDSDLAQMHLYGYARSYEVGGSLPVSISWKAGQKSRDVADLTKE